MFRGPGLEGRGAQAAVLTVGAIVAVAASRGGETSHRTSRPVSSWARRRRQRLGQLIGAAFACWAVAGTVLLLGATYTFRIEEIPAPRATLMKTIIEGVLMGSLPWGLVLTGVRISLRSGAVRRLGLAFAIGVYLPLSSMLPIPGRMCEGVGPAPRGGQKGTAIRGPGAHPASLPGEAWPGVAIAALVAAGIAPKSLPQARGAFPGEAVALLAVMLVLVFPGPGRRAKPR